MAKDLLDALNGLLEHEEKHVYQTLKTGNWKLEIGNWNKP